MNNGQVESIFVRNLNLCKDIVILDGLTGTGKTMFTPLISSFKRIQNARFEYMFEYLCIAAKMSKLTEDASHSFLNLLADLKFYDGVISREVNFRPGDLSSVFNSTKSYQYIRQLWLKDGESAEERIKIEKPILFLTTHQLLSCMDPAFSAFANRLKVIEMVRHPLYLIDHWESYIMMHGNSGRDFTIWLDESGIAVPWFAHGWENKYINSSSYDKVVYSIEYLMKSVFTLAKVNNCNESIYFIPFEKFVLEPSSYISRLELFLGTNIGASTFKVLKRQHIPRKSINAGPQKSIYKRYALKVFNSEISDSDDYEHKFRAAKKNCSHAAFEILARLSEEYESLFGRWF